MGLSAGHLIVILIILMFLFGSRRLPELGRGLGEAIRSFKKGLDNDEIDVNAKKELDKEKEKKS